MSYNHLIMKTFNEKKYTTFGDIKREWMNNKKFKKEYESSRLEFALISALIQARYKNKITQKKLAKKAGLHQSAIARFESGRWNPTIAFTSKLAHALNVKIKVTC